VPENTVALIMTAEARPSPASLASTPKAMPYTSELAPNASARVAPCRKPAQVKGGPLED